MDHELMARLVSSAAAATGTVATLLQKIMAAALTAGLAALPSVMKAVAGIMATSYPDESLLIAALEKELESLLPTTPPVTAGI